MSSPEPGTSRTLRSAMRVISVPWHHPGAVALRAEMTVEMSARYADRAVDPAVFGVEHDSVVWTGLVMGRDGHPTGHAALRTLGGAVELKRLFVTASHRGRGVAAALLDASHHMARSLGHQRVVLQTGDRQPEAVRCYERAGYHRIPIFPPYEQVRYSICMEVALPPV